MEKIIHLIKFRPRDFHLIFILYLRKDNGTIQGLFNNLVPGKTYVIVGSGEPPILLHVKSCFLSSVATAMLPGATIGGCGGVKIVKL